MGGGLMQLVAYGAQDVYLTGQPKVTFFQAVYKRHTNFAMENIQQTINGTATNGGRVSVTIARNGDLVGNMYVALLPTTSLGTTSTNSFTPDMCWIAERAISSVELTIGGQRIDKHYQTWFRLYAEVFLGESDKIAYGKLSSCSVTPSAADPKTYVYLPLLFFFNRNPGLYLPLIALQYHEVRLDFDLTSYYQAYFGGNNLEVWANYIYLDTEERRRFAQKGHEYLIEQVQHTGGDSITLAAGGAATAATIRLSFNHPVKELIWCYTNTSATANNSMWNFSTSCSNVQMTVTSNTFSTIGVMPHEVGAPRLFSNIYGTASGLGSNAMPGALTSGGGVYWFEEGAPVASSATGVGGYEVGPLLNFKVILNGQDRFKEQVGKYFNQYMPLMYHTGTPYVGIYNYSFALQPEEHQPTGTCNFSRIDNAQVILNLKAGATTTLQKMFAVNYNILRIQSGMGGLAFSN
jgi:hypothetical protein